MRDFNRILGTGLGKTGTTSLFQALQILGIKTLHSRPHFVNMRLKEKQKEVAPFSLLNNRYRAYSDVSSDYRSFEKYNPGSLYIETYRDEEEWIDSVITHCPCSKYPDKKKARERLRLRKKKHDFEIRKYFCDRADFLLMNITEGDGWKELCGFLDVEIPDVPFPRSNQVGQKRRIIANIFKYYGWYDKRITEKTDLEVFFDLVGIRSERSKKSFRKYLCVGKTPHECVEATKKL